MMNNKLIIFWGIATVLTYVANIVVACIFGATLTSVICGFGCCIVFLLCFLFTILNQKELEKLHKIEVEFLQITIEKLIAIDNDSDSNNDKDK